MCLVAYVEFSWSISPYRWYRSDNRFQNVCTRIDYWNVVHIYKSRRNRINLSIHIFNVVYHPVFKLMFLKIYKVVKVFLRWAYRAIFKDWYACENDFEKLNNRHLVFRSLSRRKTHFWKVAGQIKCVFGGLSAENLFFEAYKAINVYIDAYWMENGSLNVYKMENHVL